VVHIDWKGRTRQSGGEIVGGSPVGFRHRVGYVISVAVVGVGVVGDCAAIRRQGVF
jgi:hypothetical protein